MSVINEGESLHSNAMSEWDPSARLILIAKVMKDSWLLHSVGLHGVGVRSGSRGSWEREWEWESGRRQTEAFGGGR